jgi:hypothetical protein
MKYALTFLVILLLSVGTNAQANDSVSNYIMQKQMQASQVKLNSSMKVVQLRSQPKNVASFVNTTPMADSDEGAMLPPSPEELESIATAAGGKSTAKVSTK